MAIISKLLRNQWRSEIERTEVNFRSAATALRLCREQYQVAAKPGKNHLRYPGPVELASRHCRHTSTNVGDCAVFNIIALFGAGHVRNLYGTNDRVVYDSIWLLKVSFPSLVVWTFCMQQLICDSNVQQKDR